MENKAADDSFMKGMGNNRVLEARRIKKYCSKQESCLNCIFYNPRHYSYNSTCLISELRRPKNWDI